MRKISEALIRHLLWDKVVAEVPNLSSILGQSLGALLLLS